MKDFCSGIKNLFKNLIQPFSPVITLIIGGLISSYINEAPIKMNYVIYGLSIWFIISCSYQIYINKVNKMHDEMHLKENEIRSLKNTVKEKDRQIKSNIGLIEGRYGEFAKYINLIKQNEVCDKIINKFPYIDAVQIYKYSIGSKNNTVSINVSYECGAEYSNVDVNVIKQHYFNIQKNVYLGFMEVNELYTKIELNDLSKDIEVKELLINKAFNLLELIENKSPENLRIFVLINEMLNSISETNYKNLEISDSFRTGILGTILSNRDYLYYYDKKKKSKKNRIYFSFNDIINGENKIITLVINGSVIDEKNEQELFSLINNVIEYYEINYNQIQR